MKEPKNIIVGGDYSPGSKKTTCDKCGEDIYYKGMYDDLKKVKFICTGCFLEMATTVEGDLDIDTSAAAEKMGVPEEFLKKIMTDSIERSASGMGAS